MNIRTFRRWLLVTLLLEALGCSSGSSVPSGSSAVQASFFVAGAGWPASVTPYVTSASSNLTAGTAITLTDARFSGSLAAQSITTFVGRP